MAARSPTPHHSFWGTFTTRYLLPNVAGSPTQSPHLQAGDVAWVSEELAQFHCLVPTLGAAQWARSSSTDLRFGSAIFEDWISAGGAGNNGWTVSSSGAGAGTSSNAGLVAPLRPGVIQSATGTTTTGRSAVHLGTNTVRIPPAPNNWVDIELAVALSATNTANDQFVSRFGLGNNHAVDGEHSEAIMFRYSTVSTNWQCVTISGSSATVAATSVPVVPSFWYRLRIFANSTVARFWINDSFVASIATNIPTAALAPGAKIQKTLGGANRIHALDYFSLRFIFASPR